MWTDPAPGPQKQGASWHRDGVGSSIPCRVCSSNLSPPPSPGSGIVSDVGWKLLLLPAQILQLPPNSQKTGWGEAINSTKDKEFDSGEWLWEITGVTP